MASMVNTHDDVDPERDDGHREQRLADHRPDEETFDHQPHQGGEAEATNRLSDHCSHAAAEVIAGAAT